MCVQLKLKKCLWNDRRIHRMSKVGPNMLGMQVQQSSCSLRVPNRRAPNLSRRPLLLHRLLICIIFLRREIASCGNPLLVDTGNPPNRGTGRQIPARRFGDQLWRWGKGVCTRFWSASLLVLMANPCRCFVLPILAH